MGRNILKAGNVILKTGSAIFTTGDERPPILDLDPRLMDQADNTPVPVYWDSGSGFHFVQNVATNQPTFKHNQLNGYSAIDFDGVDDFMNATVAAPTYTLFIIFRSFKGSASTLMNSLDSNGYWDSQSASIFDWPGGFAASSERNRLFVNGGRVDPISSALFSPNWTLLALDHSAQRRLSTLAFFFNRYFKGQFARILGYDYRMPDYQRIRKETELKAFYAL